MSKKREYYKILQEKFSNINLNKPLFYNNQFGLRFSLQENELNVEDYFENCYNRSIELFENLFSKDDEVLIVLNEYKWRNRRIRKYNFLFKQIKDLKLHELEYKKFKKNNYTNIWNQVILKTNIDKIKYKNIFKAIINIDFPSRVPRMDNCKNISNKGIFFLNIENEIVFHMYDDRGIDIIANNIETLRPMYVKFKDWILSNDLPKIEKILSI